MPYYIHPKDVVPSHEWAEETDAVQYADREAAHRDMVALRASATHKITYLPHDYEVHKWRERERNRFGCGLYLPVPWASEPLPEACHEHYCHMAIKGDSGLIAYTKSVEQGCQDRQTRVRPGRYLEQFYSHIDKAQRDRWIAECQVTDTTLQIATTPEDIETVYAGGPESCMSGELGGEKSTYWGWNARPHPPVRAYGNSDFGVVYTGPMTRASGRCVVRLAEKTFTRIYGDVDRLALLLERNGYTLGTVHGARLRAIRDCDSNGSHNGHYLAPYVDGLACYDSRNPHHDGQTREHVAATLSECGQYLILGPSGRLSVTETYGSTASSEDAANGLDREYTCERCSEPRDEDEAYCSSCQQDLWFCRNCNYESFIDDDCFRTQNGTPLCESCYDDQHCTCTACKASWDNDDICYSRRNERTRLQVANLCESCAPNHTFCPDCSAVYDHTEHDLCPTCTVPKIEDEIVIKATDDTDTLLLPLEAPEPDLEMEWPF